MDNFAELWPRAQFYARDGGANDDFKKYHYHPSLGAAILFIILFSLVTAAHTWKLFRTRTWFFIPFVIGGFCKSIPVDQCYFAIR